MISVSFLKSKYSRLDTLKLIDESIADFIHVDLMDGIYTENCNFTIDEILDELKDVTKPLDIHLMVRDPQNYIASLALLKPSIITIHPDATKDIKNTIMLIKDYNIKVGLALKPDDSVYSINEYLDIIDYVLVMSVNPGAGGQTFKSEVLSKISELESKNILIGIDGGVNSDNISLIKKYHLDIIVSGSFICMSDDYNKQIELLK